jgi:hypothetical protein
MTFLGGAAWSRRAIVVLGLGAVLAVPSFAAAQAAQAPAAGGQAPASGGAAPAQPDPFKFSSDAALMQWIIAATGADEFEKDWALIKSRLSASTKPDLKALGDGLHVYKIDIAPAPAADGTPSFTYLVLADPASKTMTYAISPFLLFEAGCEPAPAPKGTGCLFKYEEGDEIFKKLQGVVKGIGPNPLKVIK